MEKIICSNTKCEYCNPELCKPLGQCTKENGIVVLVGPVIGNSSGSALVECKSFILKGD